MNESWDNAIIGAELISTISQMAAIADVLDDASRTMAADWLIKTAAKHDGLSISMQEAHALLLAAREGVTA